MKLFYFIALLSIYYSNASWSMRPETSLYNYCNLMECKGCCQRPPSNDLDSSINYTAVTTTPEVRKKAANLALLNIPPDTDVIWTNTYSLDERQIPCDIHRCSICKSKFLLLGEFVGHAEKVHKIIAHPFLKIIRQALE